MICSGARPANSLMLAARDAMRAAWLTAGCLSLMMVAPEGWTAEAAAAPSPSAEKPAAESPPAKTPSAATPPAGEDSISWLDKPRDYLSEHFVNLSTRMDAFFGDERVFDESRKSFLRVYGDFTYSESRASSVSISPRAGYTTPGTAICAIVRSFRMSAMGR